MLTGKIVLYVYQRQLPDGYPIKIRLTDGTTKRSIYIRTGYYSRKKDFDIEPKRSHPQYDELVFDYFDWRKKIATLLPRANRNSWSLDYLAKQFKRSDRFDVDEFIETLNVSKATKDLFRSAIKWLQCEDFNTLTSEYVARRISQWQHSNNGLNVYLRSLRSVWNKAVSQGYSRGENPFVGKFLPSEKTRSKALNLEELQIILKSRDCFYKDVFLLLFYIGGIDFVDLVNLNYKAHYKNGRVCFKRFKGGTNEVIDNKVFPQAKSILDRYRKDNSDYFMPELRKRNVSTIRNNFCRRFGKPMGLEIKTKSARYSFIQRAKELLIDERITMELVGYARRGTHSIYQSDFPLSVRDEAHERIISI